MNTLEAQAGNVFGRIATLAATYGIDTSALFDRLTILTPELAELAIVNVGDRFDRISVATQLAREPQAIARMRAVCGEVQARRVERLGVDTRSVYVECDAFGGASPTTSVQMFGKRTLDRDLALLAVEGVEPGAFEELRSAAVLAGTEHVGLVDTESGGKTAWTLHIAQNNRGDEARAATKARVRAVAERLGLSSAAVNAADGLHDPFAKDRDSYLALTVSRELLEPALTVTWSDIAWEHVVRVMIGFYPADQTPTKLGGLSGAFGSETASAIELVLGRTEPPRMRVATILTKGRA